MISTTVSDKMRRISYFAAITIVMMHAGAYFDAASNIKSWTYSETLEHNLMGFMNYIGTISMSWFFFSTGFFFFLGYDGKDYCKKIGKRVKTLLIPYFLWNLIMWGYNFLLYLRVGKVDLNLILFFKSFIFFYWPGVKMWSPINLPLWYIIRIFSYFIIAPAIYWILKNKVYFIVSETILFGGIFLFNIKYYSFFYWLPIFLFGGYIAINKLTQFEHFFCRYHKCSLLRNTYATVIYLLGGGIAYIFNINTNIVRYIGFIWIMAFLYFYQPRKIGWNEKHASFFIYCSHFLVINFCVRLFNQFFILQNSILQYIGLVIFSVLIIEIVAWTLWHFAPKLYAILSGGR